MSKNSGMSIGKVLLQLALGVMLAVAGIWPKHPQGGIVKQEAGVHISNLQVVDPKTGKATRIGRKMVDGKNVRFAKKSGEEIK